MSLARRPVGIVVFRIVLVVAAATICGQPLAAADPASPLDAALAAGEFSVALDAADRLDGPHRDAALSTIAAAQAEVGAPQAAAATVAVMRDDRLRAHTMRQVFYGDESGVPPGFRGAAGGGVNADFDSLIDLITSTIRQQDWQDNGGTIGFIRPHEGGIFVDAAGAVKPIENAAELTRLAAIRRDAARVAEPGGARRPSTLRKISLVRLERELQLRREMSLPVDDEMRTLAGLRRVTHLFVYPESGDVVLAGPAGDWYSGRENRILAVADDRPVVLLEDLVTLVRREFEIGGPFGCSIEPTQAGLQRVQAFVDRSRSTPLAPGTLNAWVADLRQELGPQNVRVFGVEPRTRVARLLVEADYRMKLVGIDREEGTPNVPSYFDIVRAAGREPPSMGLLRWWFTADYDSLLTSADRDVYELNGQGVLLQSEDELLSAQGERVSTGKADDMNGRYSANFTKHFAEIAQKYPLYADLQNVFDLAVVSAVLKNEGVCDRVGWHRLGFADPTLVAPPHGAAPTTVDSVANGASLSKSRVMAVISGGVRVDLAETVNPQAIAVDERGRLAKERQSAAPTELPVRGWWWD